MRTRKTTFLRTVALATIVLAVPACAGDTADTDTSSELGPDGIPLNTVFTRTIVRIGPDGSKNTTLVPVTYAQQIAERDAEARGERYVPPSRQTSGLGIRTMLIEDPTCDPDSLRLWASTNYVGDQICFTDTGGAALNDFWIIPPDPPDPGEAWGGKVRSFKAGNKDGDFDSHSNPTYLFYAYDERPTTVGDTAWLAIRNAWHVARY